MKYLYSLFLLLIINFSSFCQVPAFPGAEGYGTQTPGGRGGQVIKVTNLNDRGPGSFRAAVEAEGPRIVVFETSGIIDLETVIRLTNPYITIAGQTAPGDGICLRGETLRLYTHDIVIRYLRFRPGDVDFGEPNTWDRIDALSISSGYNIVIDHCSLSWAVDENIDMWHDAHDITVQNCIIAEALQRSKHPTGTHSTGMLIGDRATRVSVHHNIFAHNNDRNPHVNGKSIVDIRNNVIYNPGRFASDIRSASSQAINYVNNYVIGGPSTNIPGDIVIRNLEEHATKVYLAGNVGVSNAFKAVYGYDNERKYFTNDSATIASINQKEPYPTPYVTTMTAEEALDYVLAEAGATLPRRDHVDRKIVDDIIQRKGSVINSKGSLLAWPPLNTTDAPPDGDGDGMPDRWEADYGLNTKRNDGWRDSDQDGYTNVEEYLNSTNPSGDDTFALLSFSTRRAAIEQQDQDSELAFGLQPNYPNPYDDHTNLKFTVTHPSNVTLKVFDRIGKEVASLLNAFLYEGEYHVVWNTEGLRTGIYQVVIVSDQQVRGIKTVLSR